MGCARTALKKPASPPPHAPTMLVSLCTASLSPSAWGGQQQPVPTGRWCLTGVMSCRWAPAKTRLRAPEALHVSCGCAFFLGTSHTRYQKSVFAGMGRHGGLEAAAPVHRGTGRGGQCSVHQHCSSVGGACRREHRGRQPVRGSSARGRVSASARGSVRCGGAADLVLPPPRVVRRFLVPYET